MSSYTKEFLQTSKALELLNDLISGLLERERKLIDIVQNITDELNKLKSEPKSTVHNHYHYANPSPIQPNYPYYDVWCKTESNYKHE